MAELDTSSGGGKKGGKKVRSKKQSTRVDLTAMVDLAFLLITFFMLTTTLLKPQAMDISMPDKDANEKEKLKIADNRTMTILLAANNKIEWYMGAPDAPKTPTQDYYGVNGIVKSIAKKQKEVLAETGDPKQDLIVLIKPSNKSNYRNLVDILDYMEIKGVKRYAISEILDLEVTELKKNNIY